MSDHRPPSAPFNTPPSGGDPFAPEEVDEQIAARLDTIGMQAATTRETRLVRALASAYALPPEAEQALPRAHARIRMAQVAPGQPHGPSGGYVSRLTSTRPGIASMPTDTQPPRHGPNRGMWAGIAAAVVVALLVGLFARLLVLRGPASPAPAPTPTYGVIYTLALACPTDQANCDIASHIATNEQILTQRADYVNGYTFATATQTGPTMLQIKVPGAQNTENLRNLMTTTGNLAIVDTGGTELTTGTTVAPGTYPVALRGAQLDPSSITATTDPSSGQPVVTFAFAGSAKAQFAQYTQANIGKYLTITLDNTVIESAVIQSEIDGLGQITGIGTVDQAKLVAAILKGGTLPLAVTITETQTYGTSTPVATTSTATATSTIQPSVAAGTGWTAMPGLPGLTVVQGAPVAPSIAPTDANTAYIFSFATPSCKGCAQPAPDLERTEDGGTTWQPMTMPSQLKGINYADGSATAFPVAVSPVDAHLIFETVSLMANQCPEPAYQSSCLVTFRSADAGNSWQMLSFPVPGALEWAPVGMPNALQVVVESGGAQRLYATVDTGVPASSGTIPSARLVVSADDGQTWKVVDSTLANKNQGIAAYAVVTPGPQGDQIYALSEPINGGSETYSPTYQLWVSHDGGVTWTQGKLPTGNPHSFLAAQTDGYGTLYLDGDAGQSGGAIQVFASTDGGAHWTASPTAGLPGGAQLGDLFGTVTSGTGTISVLEFALDNTSNGASFYEWSVGSPGWTYVAPPAAAGADPSGDPPVVVSALGGRQQIVEMYIDNSSTLVARYALGG